MSILPFEGLINDDMTTIWLWYKETRNPGNRNINNTIHKKLSVMFLLNKEFIRRKKFRNFIESRYEKLP